MVINEHVVAYQSVINPDFTVFVVYKEHEGYNGVKESLKRMNDSIASLWMEKRYPMMLLTEIIY